MTTWLKMAERLWFAFFPPSMSDSGFIAIYPSSVGDLGSFPGQSPLEGKAAPTRAAALNGIVPGRRFLQPY